MYDCSLQLRIDDPQGSATHTLFLLLENCILPVILVGFSRGGLVLNQIIVELGTAVYSDALMQRIREIHWLDCANGVSGLCYPDIENGAASFLQLYR